MEADCLAGTRVGGSGHKACNPGTIVFCRGCWQGRIVWGAGRVGRGREGFEALVNGGTQVKCNSEVARRHVRVKSSEA